jgi:hypothetical protein
MQRFTGQIVDGNGKNLEGAKVTLNGENITKKTTTNKNGYYTIIVPNDIDSTKTTLTYSKEGLTLKTIKNPQPTSTFIPPLQSQIDDFYGGKLNLNNSFTSGKYLITSLTEQDINNLDFELFHLKEFIKTNPKNYNIYIVASESRIPNYDREEFLEDGSPNDKWAGPEGEFRSEGKLQSKELSIKRFNSLKKYIEDSFKEEGLDIPTISSKYLIGTEEYNPPTLKSNATPEEIKEHERKLVEYKNKFVKDQYVNLNVTLVQASCKTRSVDLGDKKSTDTLLLKPPLATKITLDAFAVPDRFGINGKFQDYYTQNPSAPGNLLTWEFIVYLSIYGTPLINDDTIKKTLVLKSDVRKSLQTDLDSDVPRVKVEITQFIYNRIASRFGDSGANTWASTINRKSNSEILDDLFTYVDANVVDYTFKYPVKRENTVFSLNEISESFTLNQRKGAIISPSVYSFNMCDK